MADWYNVSAITGNDPLQLIQSVNTNLFFNFFGSVFLLVVFIIAFRSMVAFNNNPKLCFLYSSFFVFMLSVPLRALSLANDATVFITLGLLALSVVVYFLMDDA